jgi:D-3-phosphoglycerate dehydrogenase
MLKILLTHTPQARRKYFSVRDLAELGALADMRFHEGNDPLGLPRLIAAAHDVDALITDRPIAGTAAVFAGLPSLKVFFRCAVDIRNVDVPAASAAGVLVVHTAIPGFIQPVAELAIGHMLDLSRGISRATADYRAGRVPEARMGRELSGSTVGIIGYGGIGRRLVLIAAAFGMTVLITDPYATVEDPRFTQVTMEELLARSDYVVCLAIATDETENLINAEALGRMKPSAFFLNLSRGSLVDDTALAVALTEGRIAGAAVDVGRGPDYLPTPVVAGLPNVIATPHVGGLTPQAIERQALDMIRQVAIMVGGEVPPGAVNPAHWTRRV